MQRQLGSSSRVQIPEARSVESRMNETTLLPLYRRYSIAEGRKGNSRYCSPQKKMLLRLIPILVLLCFFICWFSYPVNLETKDGRIMGAARAVRQTNQISHLLANYQPSESSSMSPPYPSIVSQVQTVGNDTVESNANSNANADANANG